MLALGLLSVAAAASTASAVGGDEHAYLGPGRNVWQRGDPARYGLNATKLAEAAELIRTKAAERFCLLVVKDGVIVHESVYANTTATVYESDSLGKTITASVVSAAVEQGIVDLDTPIVEYGVKPAANWSASGVDYFPRVTLRHLLGQSSGYGTVPPGSKMTYDSGYFIQHISLTLTAALKKKGIPGGALAFASSVLAAPLGLPDLYAYDELGEDISAGGGQMVSCRDMARVAQLVLNKGLWRDAAGKPYRMASARFFEEMLQPVFPGTIDGYGLLTWLNTDMTKPVSTGTSAAPGGKRSHCCAPRWGGSNLTTNKEGVSGTCCTAANGTHFKIPCDLDLPVIPEWAKGGSCAEDPRPACAKLRDVSEYIIKQTIGDTFPFVDRLSPDASPEGIGFGMGERAQYVYIDPTQNLSVVTMGQSFGRSSACAKAYDDGFTLSLIWKLLSDAMGKHNAVPQPGSANGTRPLVDAAHYGVPRGGQGRDRTWATIREDKAAYEAAHAVAAAKASGAGAAGRSASAASGLGLGGSCLCQCPPDQGFGKCWNVPKADVPKAPADGKCPPHIQAKFPPPQDFCPRIGTPTQCQLHEVGTRVCNKGGVQPDCALVPGSKELASANCVHPFDPPTWTDLNGDPGCVWQDTPCQYSPYFPP